MGVANQDKRREENAGETEEPHELRSEFKRNHAKWKGERNTNQNAAA
jgi:hypothetical protein